MSKQLPYFKFYPGDAETDENFRAMDDAEKGFYWRCLNHAWLNHGLPSDPGERARALRDKRAYADRQWERVGRCFTTSSDPHRLVNRRQEEERSKALTKSEAATRSVRTRYERMYERNTDELPRALAGAESDSDSSVVPVSEKTLKSRGRVDLTKRRTAVTDEQWPIFLDEAISHGMKGSEVDWDAANWEWGRLDIAERLAAIQGLSRDLVGKKDCLPVNYLRKKMWQRPERSSANGQPDKFSHLRDIAEGRKP